MRIKISKTIVPWKLGRELIAVGVSLSGKVSLLPKSGLYIPLSDESQADMLLPLIEVAIEAHDGIDDIADLQADAEMRVKNIPGWATWTEKQALEWFSENLSDETVDAITSLSKAKEILKKQNAAILAFARIIIAMRDRLWPEIRR